MRGAWPTALMLSLLTASVCFAAEADVPVDPLSSESLLRLAGGLLLVLLLVFAAAWLLRRLQRLQGMRPGALRIVAGLSVGQRERVLVVQVGEQQLLLGVAPGRVEKLHELAEPIVNPASAELPNFARELRQRLKPQAASKPPPGEGA